MDSYGLQDLDSAASLKDISDTFLRQLCFCFFSAPVSVLTGNFFNGLAVTALKSVVHLQFLCPCVPIRGISIRPLTPEGVARSESSTIAAVL